MTAKIRNKAAGNNFELDKVRFLKRGFNTNEFFWYNRIIPQFIQSFNFYIQYLFSDQPQFLFKEKNQSSIAPTILCKNYEKIVKIGIVPQ